MFTFKTVVIFFPEFWLRMFTQSSIYKFTEFSLHKKEKMAVTEDLVQ